jgi:hypothetical protein
LSVNVDDLGIKARRAKKDKKSTSLSFRAVMDCESGEQSQYSHTVDHQMIV